MALYDVIIRNGMVVKEEEVVKADIAIVDGRISKIADDLSGAAGKEIVDAKGLHIFPGLIDSHVHFNEPGRGDWEGIQTGSKALAAGGVTTFFDMPLNSHPPTIDKDAFDLKNNIAKQKSVVDYRLWGGVVPGNIADLEDLMNCGVIGFKAFMSGSGIEDFEAADDHTLFAAMEKIASLGGVLAVHAESDVITAQLGKITSDKNDQSAKAFSESRPIYSEIEAVQRILAYAEATKCGVHIVHISSAKVLEPIIRAKRKGINVTVETCPHYLSLTVEDLDVLGPIAKCAPPLREQAEVDHLWDAVISGDIDTIGSDHSPSLTSMKQGSLLEAWGGISGCQTTLNILLEEGYWKRDMPLTVIAKTMGINPAKRFGLEMQKGSISEYKDADLVLVNLNEEFTLQLEDLYYRNKQSPYVGKTYRGKVKQTFSKGQLVFDDQKVVPS
ncbi:allantoinase [Niallia sp. NCCP-28]|uniref:allantoinase n=1 Tax=Niallia sp. NCCP-28 TaxID=2934712 RepID=UPI00208D2D0C|nr:allantoinase [Niallia sp. NCCP-28]GKU82871.1 allantoinase [Niallia sp. NCCP-28]